MQLRFSTRFSPRHDKDGVCPGAGKGIVDECPHSFSLENVRATVAYRNVSSPVVGFGRAYHEMVAKPDVGDFGDFRQFARTFEILCAGIGIAAWMIMRNINRMSAPAQCLLEYFTRVHESSVGRSTRNKKRFTNRLAVCIQCQHEHILLFIIDSKASPEKRMGGVSIVNPHFTEIARRKTLTATPQLKCRRKFKAFHFAKTGNPVSWIRLVVFLYAREYRTPIRGDKRS